MKVNLFTTFYVDKNKLRQNELETSLYHNMLNPNIDRVFVLMENASMFYGYKSNTLKNIQNRLESENKKHNALFVKKRPTYNDYFKLTTKYKNDINIVSNTDIILDYDSTSMLKRFDWKNYCFALTRYDINNVNNLFNGKFFNRADSQDTWIKRGSFPIIPKANFTLGVAGCDNVIAYLLSQFYNVINPSLDIKTYHLHLSNVRNYIENGKMDEIERLPPPYKLLKPSKLPLEN